MVKRTDSPDNVTAQRPIRTIAAELLTPLHEINERCLHMMVLASKTDAADAPFALINALRPLLKGIRPAVRRRAACLPFALIDIEFRDVEWWRAVESNPTHLWKDRPWRAGSPKRGTVQLAHTTLVLAWHITRADAEAARVVFGMSREVAQVIRSLRLTDIDTIAERQFRHLRPRWEQQPAIWRELLLAAYRDDANAMRAFVVHALQLLMGEVIPRS